MEAKLFSESGAAARSLKNRWTKLASTYGCIAVELFTDRLLIKPSGLGGVLIRLLGLDLDHCIPLFCIQKARQTGYSGGRGIIELTYVTAGRQSRGLILYLKNHRDFIQKLNNLIDS